ncbi:MAG: alpha/beta hydrolase, partial [Acinetobacter sp.]
MPHLNKKLQNNHFSARTQSLMATDGYPLVGTLY